MRRQGMVAWTLLTSDWSLEPFSFFDKDKMSVALYLLTLLICRNIIAMLDLFYQSILIPMPLHICNVLGMF